MIFPIRTDRRLHHTPWVNGTLIAVNVVVFLCQVGVQVAGDGSWYGGLMLDPRRPEWYQFFTYQFLHAGWEHILFNMLFLWVFGNSLEDRLGPAGYLAFYLAGGVIAGYGHALVEVSPVLGASGSVSAVTGAYLALFPSSQVTLVLWFYFIHFFEVSSMVIILFAFGRDLLFHLMGMGEVAYLAHLSGNVYGFVIGMVLLATRILPRDGYDFISLFDRWRRRRQMRSVTRQGASPWQHEPATPPRHPRKGKAPADERIMQTRSDVADALAGYDNQRALDAFERLLEIDPHQVMPRQTQLDLANHAMTNGRQDTAAKAYEGFLRVYSSDPHAGQVRLMLGLIYTRYRSRPDRARELLEQARDKLSDSTQQQMAQQLLSELPDQT